MFTDFKDSSTNDFAITANGNAQLVKGVKKYGNAAGYFDGSGDYLIIENPSQNLINWFESDFTIETWVYLDSTPTDTVSQSSPMIGNGNPFSSEEYFSFGVTHSLSVKFKYWNGSEQGFATSPSIISIGQWYHIAFVKNGTNLKIYIDGVEMTSSELVGTPIVSDGVPFVIGGLCTGYFNGRIEDLRITKGIARYTANFTPPTQQLPDPSDPHGANVSLLLHMDGTNGSQSFVDSSNNNLTITVNGDAQISTAEKKFGNGSAYFRGNSAPGDALILNGSSKFAFGTDDFTIEFWAYVISYDGNIYESRGLDEEGDRATIYVNSNNFIFYDAGNRIVSDSKNTYQWYHVAVSRSSGVTRLFIDGVQEGANYSDSTDYGIGSNRPFIGGYNETASDGWFNGYIDDLRITKGVARYTANFIPQTAAFANPIPVIPLPIPSNGLMAWFKADVGVSESGGTITEWADQSGNDNNATAVGQPTLLNNELNGKPVIGFDGVNDCMTFSLNTPISLGSARTFIIVYKYNTMTGQTVVFDAENTKACIFQSNSDLYYNDSSQMGPLSGDFITNYFIETITVDTDGSATLRINGVDEITENMNNPELTNFIIAARNALSPTQHGDCNISEVIIYNRKLSTQEIETIELYANIP
jgi:hypothetical protein